VRNRVAELVQLGRQSGYTHGELVRMITDAPERHLRVLVWSE
jgi:hypothetical protein